MNRLIAVAIAILDADKQILIPRPPNLHPKPTARAEVPAGEAHEGAHRRMLGVEADVAGKRSGVHDAIAYRADLEKKLNRG